MGGAENRVPHFFYSIETNILPGRLESNIR